MEGRGPAAELCYRGRIAAFDPGTGLGAVQSVATGREIPFELRFVDLGGGGGPPLEVGQEVGYDVGWTSRGLRVTRLFPFPDASAAR